jgi:hypothetical protein
MELQGHLTDAITFTSSLSAMNTPEEVIRSSVQEQYDTISQNEYDLIFSGRDEVMKTYQEYSPEMDSILQKEEVDEDVLEEEIKELLKSKQVNPALIHPVYLTAIITSAADMVRPFMSEAIQGGASLEETIAALKQEGIEADYLDLLYENVRLELIDQGVPITEPAQQGSPPLVILSGVIFAIMGLFITWQFEFESSIGNIFIGVGILTILYGVYKMRKQRNDI